MPLTSLDGDQVDQEEEHLTLNQVLIFMTGLVEIPPLGFPSKINVQFLHSAGKVFPEANTCDYLLSLPLHGEYDDFCQRMTSGILQSPVIGVA